MRPIHLARLDKTRPAVVLTREAARGAMNKVTVAPITSTIRGLVSEVPVGPRHGLDRECVITCDNIQTIPVVDLGRAIGLLDEDSESALAKALVLTFDLAVEELPGA